MSPRVARLLPWAFGLLALTWTATPSSATGVPLALSSVRLPELASSAAVPDHALAVRQALLAGHQLGLPPAPPTSAGTVSTADAGDDRDDRPVYRRGWFYLVAAGIAAVTVAWIRESGDGHDGEDDLSPKQDPGFPPPPGAATAVRTCGERSNR